MNGAESLVRTLISGGVEVCFTNPGTTEMHLVAAFDSVPGLRCVPGLFEGVVTGAADGYYRIAGKPAATLLHLGPGLGNGLANLHNARKARSGIVNLVGEHASFHIQHDAPLTSDIAAVAAPMSDWVRTAASSRTLASDCADAIAAARTVPGQVATLIIPADTAWQEAGGAPKTQAPAPRPRIAHDSIGNAAKALRAGAQSLLFLGGAALREKALELSGRIAAKTGCRLLAENQNARLERGAGRVIVERLPYPVDAAVAALCTVRQLVLVGAKAPVAFFAYPGKPSVLAPKDCVVTKLAGVEEDIEMALESLAAEVNALDTNPLAVASNTRPSLPAGEITLDKIAAILGALLPENAIVVDESISSGRGFFAHTAGAPRHDWLNVVGGSIGYGLPAAIGAAIAAPQRKVIALEGDGSAMYTPQALWTMARESLDVTIIVFANRSYNILRGELAAIGVPNPGARAGDLLSLERPTIDWVKLAAAMGVEASRATNCEGLARAFKTGLESRGPYLVELVL